MVPNFCGRKFSYKILNLKNKFFGIELASINLVCKNLIRIMVYSECSIKVYLMVELPNLVVPKVLRD